jgi:hypothetical protein
MHRMIPRHAALAALIMLTVAAPEAVAAAAQPADAD